LSINENAGEWICLKLMKAKAKSKSVSVNTPIEFYHLKCHLLQRIPIKTGTKTGRISFFSDILFN
jgi:hypothetical protein